MFVDSFSKVPVRLVKGAALNRKLYLMSPCGVMLNTRLEDDPVIPLNKAAVVVRPHACPPALHKVERSAFGHLREAFPVSISLGSGYLLLFCAPNFCISSLIWIQA